MKIIVKPEIFYKYRYQSTHIIYYIQVRQASENLKISVCIFKYKFAINDLIMILKVFKDICLNIYIESFGCQYFKNKLKPLSIFCKNQVN